MAAALVLAMIPKVVVEVLVVEPLPTLAIGVLVVVEGKVREELLYLFQLVLAPW